VVCGCYEYSPGASGPRGGARLVSPGRCREGKIYDDDWMKDETG